MTTVVKQKLVPRSEYPYGGSSLQRFLLYVDRDFVSEDSCLLWKGRLSADGYGKLGKMFAHRHSYELFVGWLDWLCALHTCDVRNCVNPLHLYAGTKLDNARDREGRNRGNQPSGESHGGVVLTDNQILRLMDLHYKDRWSISELSREYNVAVSSIQRYIMGDARADITKNYLCGLNVDDLSIRGHKLKDSEVLEIFRLRHNMHMGVKDIAAMYQISKSQVRRYLCGETKPHVFQQYMKSVTE